MRERHLADLVEEQRAAVGLLERARVLGRSAPVKAPRSWPNSSLSISSSGMAAQLTATNGPRGALAAQVDGLGDQLLARAALARDQHPRIGGRHFLDQAEDRLDRRRGPDHLVALAGSPSGRRCAPVPAASAAGRSPGRSGYSSHSIGFSRKSKAPILMASTALAMVPWPDSRMTGRAGKRSRMALEAVHAVARGHDQVEDQGVDRDFPAGRQECGRCARRSCTSYLLFSSMADRLANSFTSSSASRMSPFFALVIFALGGGPPGNKDSNSRSNSLLALHNDRAAVGGDDALAYGQADAKPFLFGRIVGREDHA